METEQFGFTYGGMDMSIHSHIQTKQQLNKKICHEFERDQGRVSGRACWEERRGGNNIL